MNLLKFGTSVFHAYVHEWSCQLRYNPRLNPDWGMSDGEGLERIWAFLSPLISQLRYSTKAHRLAALNWRSLHHNQNGRFSACAIQMKASCDYNDQTNVFVNSTITFRTRKARRGNHARINPTCGTH